MATDRYTRIESLDKQAYSPEAPVLFDKGALLVDNVKKINVLQLQFENISNKNIIELEIKITCRDKHGALLGDVIHIYFGSDMVPNETFGSNVGITVENSAARIFDFDIERVVFGDGSILQNHIPLDKHFDRRPIFQMDNFNVVSNYLAEEHISTYNGCIPEFKEYGWRCICGRINKPASEECRVCKAPKKVLENVIFGDAIEKKAMQLEKHREKRNKTLHMILKIAIPIAIIALCLLIFGMYQHQKSDEYIKSTDEYKEAMQLCKGGKHLQALHLFKELGYKKGIENCSFHYARSTAAEGRLNISLQYLEQLGSLTSDAAKLKSAIEEAEELAQDNPIIGEWLYKSLGGEGTVKFYYTVKNYEIILQTSGFTDEAADCEIDENGDIIFSEYNPYSGRIDEYHAVLQGNDKMTITRDNALVPVSYDCVKIER